MIDIGKMIKQLRTDRDWTQDQLAKMLHISKQTISNYENGRREPDYETLEAIADIFNVPMGFFLTQEEEREALAAVHNTPAVPGFQTSAYTPARAMVPVIGSVRCGPGGLAFEELQGAEMADVANPSEYFYLTTTGDSMAPDIKEGDLVLVHIQPTVETGELAVVIINGEEGTLKKLLKRENAVILQSLNPAFPPRVLVGEELENMRIVGKAVQLVRKW